MRTLCRAPFPHVDAMTRPRSMTICASRRRPMTICASHYVRDQHLVCSSLCLMRGFSFLLFLSGITHWSLFLKVGLRPEGCAREDFIPDRRREIVVGCTHILLFAL